VLGAAQVQGGGRRIAVLGDMLELGDQSARLHADLAAPLTEAGVDLVFTAGDAMRALDVALPTRRRGAHAATAAELAPTVAQALKPGDAVMVKGSHGSRMRDVVARLTAATAEAERS
jgi:UDP-N-acetylmuramoyl-tripeptide--D-alanyl-D-alanine ligase